MTHASVKLPDRQEIERSQSLEYVDCDYPFRSFQERNRQLLTALDLIRDCQTVLNDSQNQLALAATQFGAKFAGGECLDLIDRIHKLAARLSAAGLDGEGGGG